MAIDFKEAAYLLHQTFRELSVHEMRLATSLQGLAPTNKQPASQSAQYLYENSLMLKELSEKVKDLVSSAVQKKNPSV